MIWAITILGALGVAISTYTAVDAHRDLQTRRRSGMNGLLELAGRIARRAATSSGIMHFTFLFLGLLTLVPMLAVLARLLGQTVLGLAIVLMQLAAILAQVRNQWDRRSARREK